MMRIVKWLGWLAVVLLLLASVLGLVGCEKQYKFNSIDVTGADWGKNLFLLDLNGNSVGTGDFKGKVTAVFFGFLSCPDACPNTLNSMVKLKKILGKKANEFQVIFVSIDPERDTPENLRKFLSSFDDDFQGLIAPIDYLNELQKEFKLVVQKVFPDKMSKDEKGFYLIDHTTHTYIFDKKGNLRLIWPESTPLKKLLSDIRFLIG
ncbi:MAG: SCO family protein [Burkholderiaceae bacterium]